MRISDWSSDVCSSDLADDSRRRPMAWTHALTCPFHSSKCSEFAGLLSIIMGCTFVTLSTFAVCTATSAAMVVGLLGRGVLRQWGWKGGDGALDMDCCGRGSEVSRLDSGPPDR